MKYLIFGANGQVGKALQALSLIPGDEMIFCTRADCDITQPEEVERVLIDYAPKVVINCAAYTKVDLAEEEQEVAYLINATAVENVALLCKKYNALLIHISTDYVFSSNVPRQFVESDQPNPLNVYGASKLEGEKAIRNVHSKHLIIRTSWVFGEHGHNFVKAMLGLALKCDSLSIVDDQHSAPTSARSLAEATYKMSHQVFAKDIEFGTYHFCNYPYVTWYEFASEIFKQKAAIDESFIPPKLTQITSSEFPQNAERPSWSVLSYTHTEYTTQIAQTDWRNELINILSLSI